jgi:hypothetical protein
LACSPARRDGFNVRIASRDDLGRRNRLAAPGPIDQIAAGDHKAVTLAPSLLQAVA